LVAEQILSPLDSLSEVRQIILQNHEWYNGNGYPFGKDYHSLELGGMILSVADTFDALTADRPYRRGIAPEAALKEITRFSGTQFCPAVVNAFTKVMESNGYALPLKAFPEKEEVISESPSPARISEEGQEELQSMEGDAAIIWIGDYKK